jgi:hypothetical protein
MLLAILLASSSVSTFAVRASASPLTGIDIRERLAAKHQSPSARYLLNGPWRWEAAIGRDYMKVANRKKGKNPVATLQRP